MDGARALVRARQRQSRWFPAATLAFVTILLAWWLSILWGSPQSAADRTTALLFTFIWALEFLALVPAMIVGHITRVVVTSSHLHVHAGLLRADVPLEAITALALEPVRWWRSPGSALGRLLGQERVFVNFGAQHCLRVEWEVARGRKKTLWVQLDAAPELYAVLTPPGSSRTSVRVAATHAQEAPLETNTESAPTTITRHGRGG